MKKILFFTGILSLMLFVFSSCDKDQLDESIEFNQLIETKKNDNSENKGFNEYGYNWNAHHFNGILLNAILGDYINENGDPESGMDPYTGDDDSYLNDYPFIEFLYGGIIWEYRHVNLVMHWNDTLISREGVYPPSWFDTNGWITFHYSGANGNKKWSEFQKMVAARSTDKLDGGVWYDKNDVKIGIESDFNDLILIQVIETGDVPDYMYYPAYHNPTSSGLGKYKLR